MKLPEVRYADIVMQEISDEILLYNLKSHKVYSLNKTLALIYTHCDGKTTYDDLKLKYHNLSDDIIFIALDALKREGLIENGSDLSILNGFSRREVIKKAGLASMIALPIISSITAPRAAHAQSFGACLQPFEFISCFNDEETDSVCFKPEVCCSQSINLFIAWDSCPDNGEGNNACSCNDFV